MIGSKLLHPQKHKYLMEVNGESSLLFGWCAIKTKISQDWSTALKVFLDVLNSYWLQKLVELRPTKKLGKMNHGILFTCGNQYRNSNGYKPGLIDQLNSWKVVYWTSRMPGYFPIMSSDVLLALQFDSHFRIWQAFEIDRLDYPKLCIHLRGGPPTCRFYRYDCNSNGKYSRFGA